jgi:hypothetical protein
MAYDDEQEYWDRAQEFVNDHFEGRLGEIEDREEQEEAYFRLVDDFYTGFRDIDELGIDAGDLDSSFWTELISDIIFEFEDISHEDLIAIIEDFYDAT